MLVSDRNLYLGQVKIKTGFTSGFWKNRRKRPFLFSIFYWKTGLNTCICHHILYLFVLRDRSLYWSQLLFRVESLQIKKKCENSQKREGGDVKHVNSFTWPIMVQVHCVIALKVLQKWKWSQHTLKTCNQTSVHSKATFWEIGLVFLENWPKRIEMSKKRSGTPQSCYSPSIVQSLNVWIG